MHKNRADALVPALLVLGALLIAADVVWTFTLAPLVQGAQLPEPVVIAGQMVTTKLLLSQKIFYLHVPVAVASFAAMGVAAFHALRFLMTKDRAHDVHSRTAMQITLVFIVATMISGDLWTRFEWGVWWVWEPRLTTYFILMLLVIGYFVLRNALDDPEKAARFAAVFCIVAFVDAPISFLITRLVPSSVHPVVFRTDSGLPPLMLIPFLLGMAGVLMIAFALYRYALRVNAAADEVEDLKRRLEELDGEASRAAAAAALDRLQARAADVALTGGSGGARGATAFDASAGSRAPGEADTPTRSCPDVSRASYMPKED
ncbi:cytochrome c biogenesis protein [Collinsella stercoris]|uniref:cytochrome c biogenesis protein n=1 Tax=Collinsella stercoris TaxID=147206 RepID=UPI003AEF6FB0